MNSALPVVFDLDGTLIDSAPDIHATALHVLAAEGLPALSFEQVRGFIGNGVPVLVARILRALERPDDGEQHHRMTANFLSLYEEAVDLTVLYPGVRQTLESLARAGHPMGICTNKPLAPTKAVLSHFGILDRFGSVIGGDSLPSRKPDPAPLLRSVADLGGSPVLYVGDSEVDAETAKAANMPFALFTEGYRKTPVSELYHSVSFNDFNMLQGIIEHVATESN